MGKVATEGTKNTKRDLEGSKHGAGMLFLTSQEKLQAPQSEAHINIMLVHCGLTKVVILNWKKEQEGRERHMRTSQPPWHHWKLSQMLHPVTNRGWKMWF